MEGSVKPRLKKFHPDYKKESRRLIHIGPNKGEEITTEVADILESHSRIKPELFDKIQSGIKGDHVLIVEDILDTGNTLIFVENYLIQIP
jgi:adenine/guanine phosphoribosyltransferase-like PRPP-binding protein